jgi:threonine aldolase
MEKINFAADHHAPAHPKIMEAVVSANEEIEHSYGDDLYTKRAEDMFKKTFGPDTSVYFMAGGGTAANVLALFQLLPKPFYSIICSDVAHVFNDEAGAPGFITGSTLTPLISKNGKIAARQVEAAFSYKGDYHRSQPGVVSITQATERGTVYSPQEIKEIAEVVHKHDAFLHMDGARLFNAAACFGTGPRELTVDLGVDALSLGMGKNGGLGVGEAVVFFRRDLAKEFVNVRKMSMQLASKTRYFAAQWMPMLGDNLWLENATESNNRAKELAEGIRKNSNYKITEEVQTNGVWVVIPSEHIKKLQEKFDFYRWENGIENEVRLMTSYKTTSEEIASFISEIYLLNK